ncbi:MAG: bifunctional 5,10-methylenetetrahydrofolate dehydrogenase/5,10-methenyltetrahydrofolate cyclohydrolase [Oscillospiraceae bacterium]
MTTVLSGAPVAAALDIQTMALVDSCKSRAVVPTLAILRVGEREDDISYERGAMKRCAKVGIAVKQLLLPQEVSQETLLRQIQDLNADPTVHGVLLFRPLPKTLDEKALCEALCPAKDVDGITSGSMAAVFTGSGAGYAPCTAQSCMELLQFYGVVPAGKRAVVIGRSLVIGRPVALLLLQANATVTICHTKTENLPAVVREADIVVAAAGKAETVTADYLSPGQILLDVGIHWSETANKLVGDIAFDEAAPLAAAITPVPGGVGSVTTAVLARHVAEAATKSRGAAQC